MIVNYETNLLSLVRLLLNNNCQIQTKVLQYRILIPNLSLNEPWSYEMAGRKRRFCRGFLSVEFCRRAFLFLLNWMWNWIHCPIVLAWTHGFDVSFTRLEHFCDILRQKRVGFDLCYILVWQLQPPTGHVETSRSRNACQPRRGSLPEWNTKLFTTQ